MTNMSQAFSMPQVHVGMLPATYHPEEVRLSFLIPGGIHTCTCTLGILSCDVTLNSGTCGLMT